MHFRCHKTCFTIGFSLKLYFTEALFLTFSFLIWHRKNCFWVRLSKWRFLMDLHVLKSLESEKHIFSGWFLSVCMFVYLNQCNSNSISTNFKFGILHMHHMSMLLETFHEDCINTLCTGAHKRILIHCVFRREFFVSLF